MKLIRFGEVGKEKPGVELEDGRRLDVSAFVNDYDEAFFAATSFESLKKILNPALASLPELPKEARLGPPLARPSKIVCVGLNYYGHAKETKAELPKEPVLFLKATTAWNGPYDPVLIPRGAKKLDWEVELAIVIGKASRYVPEEDAQQHIWGYALHNDYSEREFQIERGGQWDKGKGCDTFAPIGPWVLPREQADGILEAPLWLKVNGQKMQDSSASDMVFKPAKLVSYISHFMTLLPGDVISTGTPAGVALGMDPPQYLKAGDVVELGGGILGSSRQIIGLA